jgi:hypothetical protein
MFEFAAHFSAFKSKILYPQAADDKFDERTVLIRGKQRWKWREMIRRDEMSE